MTDKEFKELQKNLWSAADILRSGAHLAANKYGQPILGLIFLRYADILFKQHKKEIEIDAIKQFDISILILFHFLLSIVLNLLFYLF